MDRARGREIGEQATAVASTAVREPAAGLASARILGLQRTAGNRAVSQSLARVRPAATARVLARDWFEEIRSRIEDAKAGKYRDPRIQAVFDSYKPGSESRRLALALLDADPASPPSGRWTKVAWTDIAADAATRVCDPTLFDQGSLGTCGLAAILNFEARADPKGYASLVRECFTDGRLNGSGLNSTLLGNAPQPGMPVVDWMVMSAMQDKTNSLYDYYGRPDQASSPWYKPDREGTTNPQKESAMKKYAGALETKIIETPKADDVIPATRTVNDLLAKYPDDVEVIVSVSASVFSNPASDENKRNHAIGLTGPATITEDPGGDATKGTVRADMFSWGKVQTWSGTVRQYQHMVWAYTVASRVKGVL